MKFAGLKINAMLNGAHSPEKLEISQKKRVQFRILDQYLQKHLFFENTWKIFLVKRLEVWHAIFIKKSGLDLHKSENLTIKYWWTPCIALNWFWRIVLYHKKQNKKSRFSKSYNIFRLKIAQLLGLPPQTPLSCTILNDSLMHHLSFLKNFGIK